MEKLDISAIKGAVCALFIAASVVALSGCGSTTGSTGSQPPAKSDASGTTLPAVTQPTPSPTQVPPTPTTGMVPPTGSSNVSPTSTGLAGAVISTNGWPQSNRQVADLNVLYSYPPNWSSDLVYCPSGGKEMGSHLPAGCATTDFLAGDKLSDVALSMKLDSAKASTVGGKRLLTQVDTPFDSSKAALTYTAMLYDTSGAPLFGFVTYVGPGTSKSDQAAIVSALDAVASTLTVDK